MAACAAWELHSSACRQNQQTAAHLLLILRLCRCQLLLSSSCSVGCCLRTTLLLEDKLLLACCSAEPPIDKAIGIGLTSKLIRFN